MQTKGQLMKSLHTAFSFAPPSILSLTIFQFQKQEVVLMHRQSSIPFNQSGIGVRAITMTAKTAPANAAAPITAAVFLLRFFFTALQISMAQTTQTAATASAITSVSHNHESSYNILIRSPYLSPANWKLLFHIHAFVKFRFIQLRQLEIVTLANESTCIPKSRH